MNAVYTVAGILVAAAAIVFHDVPLGLPRLVGGSLLVASMALLFVSLGAYLDTTYREEVAKYVGEVSLVLSLSLLPLKILALVYTRTWPHLSHEAENDGSRARKNRRSIG